MTDAGRRGGRRARITDRLGALRAARFAGCPQALRTAALRVRHSLALLTERRMLLFLGLDLLFLFAGVMIGLSSDSGGARDMWLPFFVMPALLVGVPMLADTVAVERRSGTLDLALTSPGARFYFERRVLSVCALIVVQGCLAMTLTRLLMNRFPLSGPFAQAISVALFTGAVRTQNNLVLLSCAAVFYAYARQRLMRPELIIT